MPPSQPPAMYYVYFYRPEIEETKRFAHFIFRVEGQSLALRILEVLKRSDDAEFGLWPACSLRQAERDTIEVRLAELAEQASRVDLPPQKPLRAKKIDCLRIARRAARVIHARVTALSGDDAGAADRVGIAVPPPLSRHGAADQLPSNGRSANGPSPQPATSPPDRSTRRGPIGRTEQAPAGAGSAAVEPELTGAEFARLSGLSPGHVSRLKRRGIRLTLSEAGRRRAGSDGRRTPRAESDVQAEREHHPRGMERPLCRRAVGWRCPSGHTFLDHEGDKCPRCGAVIDDCTPLPPPRRR